MFRETLLESSPAGRKGKRWPMAVAFTVELAVAALLIILPLLSSGILPVLARPPLIAPLSDMPATHHDRSDNHPSSSGPHYSTQPDAVTLPNAHSYPCLIHCKPVTTEADEAVSPWDPGIGSGSTSGVCLTCVHTEKPVLGKRLVISDLSAAHLTHRVEPVYPKIAILTKIEGRVQLHAVIAKDGSIKSLEVVSGHPLLARAALEAVEQWRYEPYRLNGDPVEVETFITVNFRATGN